MDLAALLITISIALIAAVAGYLVARGRVRGAADGLRRAADRLSRLDERMDSLEFDHGRRELILRSMGEGVLLVEGDGKVRYRNPAAERMLEFPVGLAGDLPPVLGRVVRRARAGGEVAAVEFEAGLGARILQATVVILEEADLAMVIMNDVTEARRADVVRRDFVEAASHELKTPVTSIRAAAETLIEAVEGDPGAAKDFAARLLKDSERLARIVSDLLDLSRLESEETRRETVALDRIAADEADRLSESAMAAGVSLAARCDVSVKIEGSARDLALAIRNLLENAVRYTPQGGEVLISVEDSGSEAKVIVEDTGIGISTKDLPRIFERFYRVDRARSRDTGGTGLGLAIVKHVVERHGGRVEALSELGRGSKFLLILPGLDPKQRSRLPSVSRGPSQPTVEHPR